MKRIIHHVLISFSLIIFFNVVPVITYAQIDPGGDPDAPIDGGVSLLVAAGVGYGLKKIRESRKENKKGINPRN